MYDLLMHARMHADEVRCAAYERAILSVVRLGDVVIDLGTGTGIHAVLACRAGARKVYAIESSAMIQVAEEIASVNRVDDRIVFLRANSAEVSLPERADVLIADIRGVLPHFGRALPSMIDARERLLRPGARIVPSRDVLNCAVVESEAASTLHRGAWTHGTIDLSPAMRRAANATHKHVFSPDEVISSAVRIATVDYETLMSPDLRCHAQLNLIRNGRADGVAIWFDSELAAGVTMSNAPGKPELVYGQLFVPFESPVDVHVGDEVAIRVDARIREGEDDYLWRWRTAFTRGTETMQTFDQSSFFAMPELGARGE